MDSARTREIGHDEFDPRGTLALVALYFLVLTLMWLFTYFVEFLGSGPTVIGPGSMYWDAGLIQPVMIV
ncbi:signal peptidase complex subunit 2 [Natrinema caseinilyticum]|uniref:signal peptidase complex subunit 2 n=1 Tax=Natrinema caseinilyticum TaxID=2961570 RepID=UPI0020C48F4B|nr:signal peptidase complex subunit 2 [Natrinema caseinilyticum]